MFGAAACARKGTGRKEEEGKKEGRGRKEGKKGRKFREV
jgi:hypothetical protein